MRGHVVQRLLKDLNLLLENWPDKNHPYYKDLYELLKKYNSTVPEPVATTSALSGAAKQRGYEMEPWMETKEDKFIREGNPMSDEDNVDVVQDRREFAATAAEEAAVINQQVNAQGPDQYGMVMALPTDQSHWEKYGIYTGEDLAKEMLLSSYSDLYKSYHGFRPRGGGVNKNMSVDELNKALTDLENFIMSMQDNEPAVEEPEFQMAGDASIDPAGDYEEYDTMPAQAGMRRR